MISRQLELRFESPSGLKPMGRNRRRSGRARWWFAQMRGVVNEARDWPEAFPPLPAPRPGEAAANADARSTDVGAPAEGPSAPDKGVNAGDEEPRN